MTESEKAPKPVAVLTAAALGIILVGVTAWAFSLYASPWMGDAASYLEATRSFSRGEPFLLEGAPLSLFPPGYPLLAGLLTWLHMAPDIAVLFVTRASLALCLPAAYWALSPALGTFMAALAGLLCITAPGLLSNANLASSDAPFALLALIAMGLTIRGYFPAAGFVTCLGLLLRNAGLALVFAVGLAALLDAPTFRIAGTRIARLSIGGIGPVAILTAWNLWAFGTPTPYKLPPSTVGLGQNLHDMGSALAFDILPSYRFAEVSTWLALATVVLGGLTIVLLASKIEPGHAMRRGLIVVSAYFLGGIALTVAARTRYQWGEPIWFRHSSQYDWSLFPALAVALVALWPSFIRPVTVICICVVSGIVLARTAQATDTVLTMRTNSEVVQQILRTGEMRPQDQAIQLRQFFRAYEQMPAIKTVLAGLDPSCRVVSNLHDLILALYGIPASGETSWRGKMAVRSVVLVALAPHNDVEDIIVPPGMRTVVVPALPPSVHVFTNSQTCVANPLYLR